MNVLWTGYNHQQIYDYVQQGPGRAASTAAEAVWLETESLIARIDQRIAAAMAQSASGWEGAAADSARTAVSALGQWALDAANAAKLTAQGITAQGEQAANVRNAMPEPYTGAQMFGEAAAGAGKTVAGVLGFNPGSFVDGVGDLYTAATEAANREARARELMTAYTDRSTENLRNLEFWTNPPQVTVERVSDGGFGAGGGSGGAGGLTGPGASVVPPAIPPGAPGPGGVAPPAPAPSGDVTPPTVVAPPTTPPAAVPPSTPPTVTPPAVPTPPSPPLPGTPAPGVPDAGVVPPGGVVPTPPVGGRQAPGATVPTRRPEPGDVPAGGQTGPGSRPGPVPPPVPGPPRVPPAPSWRESIPTGQTGRYDARPSPQDRLFPTPPRSGAEPAARPGAGGVVSGGTGGRSPGAGSPGLYPPMAGGGMSADGREHRRPDYLIDDTDAFADDRWFTSAVITPDDAPPPFRR